jgi:CRISPR-associated endonuclease/helicase Cas3
MRPHYLAYWGKARPQSERNFPCHPLPYHSLDVAATGAALLDGDPRLALHLSARSGLTPTALRRWLLTWLAWHDVGKFSPAFQRLAPAACDALANPAGPAIAPLDYRHDAFGWWLLQWMYAKRPQVFAALSDRPLGREGLQLIQLWSAALTGHHGTPPHDKPQSVILDGRGGLFPTEALAAAEGFMADSAVLFAADSAALADADREPAIRAAPRFSWMLAGFAVLCDWIGSGQGWFNYAAPERDLAAYWLEAQERAVRAVAEAGVLPAAPSPPRTPVALFAGSGIQALRPLQTLLQSIALPEGPILLLVEDLTGSGKTEAAALFAHRLLTARRVDGVIIALPTMATANAMYDRIAAFYRRFFADEALPSIALGHGRAALRELLQSVARREEDFGGGDETASAACAAWIADDRRRAFLADIGVVTLDQAILGVLPARHQSLRLLGLGRKLLIVDEAHAYDVYMREELSRLLTFHSAQGGSAIILSATLPEALRIQFATSFARGLGSEVDLSCIADDAAPYPLVSLVQTGGSAIAMPARGEPTLREVALAWPTANEACARVVAKAREGRAVCWLRNTVGDAQAAFADLRAVAPDLPVTLFHARFAMGDRLAIESGVIRRFGPTSTAEERRGQILVATQVVEQSLDLDFDCMITDLAPIDLIIQRAGRLWRHRRPGRDGCPLLEIVAPTWDTDPSAGWYRAAFPRAAFVYKDHARLWLTARVLQEAGAIRLPQEARALIEGVYGKSADAAIPLGLSNKADLARGAALARTALARGMLLGLDDGYRRQNAPWDRDLKVATRLGDEQREYRLARWDGATLHPWAAAEDPWIAWRLSEITVRAGLVDSLPKPNGKLAIAAAAAISTWPDAKYAPAPMPLTPNHRGDAWRATGLDRAERILEISYDITAGLRVDRRKATHR